MLDKGKLEDYLNKDNTLEGKIISVFLVLINISAIIHYILFIDLSDPRLLRFLFYYEIFLVLVFSIEYALRVYIASRKIRYVFSLYSFFDILSILPIMINVYNLGFFRILRVFRILRFQKYLLNEYFFFGKIKLYQLHILRIIFIIITIVFISAGLIYTIEGREGTGVLNSFLDAVYFAVATVTTVGFGDFTPSTDIGKLITIGIIFSGITLLPYNIGKLIKAIIESREISGSYIICPHCNFKNNSSDEECLVCSNPLSK